MTRAEGTGTPTYGNYIDGEWTPASGRTFDVRDPADGRIVAHVAQADESDAHAALEAAAKAFPAWEALGGHKRAGLLQRVAQLLEGRKEEVARTMTQEMGKVLVEARGEMEGALENFHYYNAYARTLSGQEVALLPRGESLRLVLEPRGVTVALTPWNFPAATVTRKLCPILVTGNTVVLKPSSATPVTAAKIVECFHKAGVPPGVINLVAGPGETLGKALVQHPETRTVTLTGSTESGKTVMGYAATNVVKVLLELGGKAPVIVTKDADLSHAARAAAYARFWNAGQSCIAAERTYVEAAVAKAFTAKLAKVVGALRVGKGLAPNVDMGPLMSLGARDRVAQMVSKAADAGAEVLLGGRAPPGRDLANGAFYAPTLVTDLDDRSPLVRDEIFGPVLPVVTVGDFDEALARANRSRFGLSSYVFTMDARLAERAAKELKFGEVYVNRVGPESPQGYHAGYRESGLGGEGSPFGVLDYMNVKSVYQDWGTPFSQSGFFPYGKG